MMIHIPGWWGFDDEPLDDAWNKWGLGVVVPSLIALFGVSRMILRVAVLYGPRRTSLTLTGWDAIAFGASLIGVAIFMHAHYHWNLSRSLAAYADLGKVFGIILGVVAIGFVVVRNISPI